MELLILGGTRFLGPAIIDHALAKGHEVTLFNRGRSNPHLYPDLEKRRGDRDGQLDSLAEGEWDAVIDTSGYFPRHVKLSAELLAPRVGQYVFVSTISVYADHEGGGDEDAEKATMPDPTVEEITGATYGPLKHLCEQAAEAAFPGRATIVRPGLICGPRDGSDRFTYWPARVDRGGEVLAPGDPEMPVQVIDVRDLAAFLVKLCEDGHSGIFNADGPPHSATMRDVVRGCRIVNGGDATFTWVPDEFLLEHEVGPWMELPLWIPGDRATRGQWSVEAAVGAGLTFRPLGDLIRDTLAWTRTRPADHRWRAGLAADKEARVLAAWRDRDSSDATEADD
jgi:2'-hydroxyisoflavone reductase